MNAESIKAEGLRVEIISGGDTAGHQRRLQEWLEANPEAQIIDLRFHAFCDPESRTRISFSTMILYR